ncbi:hypothetical protein OG244_23230 [Streptomyces brevispora]|uniref:hypothetical protein n=1 Tax=Streptomyces brevispora TaxID=887462 RepID=UPI002E2EBF67|nr:hypothetical protein [Streptomyces brevispora]
MSPRTAATAGVPAPPGRPAQAQVHTGTLTIKAATEGRQPSAHYECHRCGFKTPTVTGRQAVAEFTAKAAEGVAAHRDACPAAHQETTQ